MEIDIQAREAQRVPKSPAPRYIIIRMPKVKDRENLKSSKRKAVCYLPRSPHKTQLISQKKFCRLEGIGKKYSKS